MDAANTNIGYLLGRLFSQIAYMQNLALGEIGASVVDKYFAGACTSPQAVFPKLLRTAIHHHRKAQDRDGGQYKNRANATDGRIRELCSLILAEQNPEIDWSQPLFRIFKTLGGTIQGFPARLDLEEQGLFVLGFHQRFAKGDEAEGESTDESAPVATSATPD